MDNWPSKRVLRIGYPTIWQSIKTHVDRFKEKFYWNASKDVRMKRSWQGTNHGSCIWTSKLNNNRPSGTFTTRQIQQKLFEANGSMLFGNNCSSRDRSIISTKNGQFWMVRQHLFARSIRKNQGNQSQKTNHSPRRQCKL